MVTKSPPSKFSPSGLKIIPLGGLEGVGRNMNVIEAGNDILIIDMGLQFPEEDMHGIDYIIPDISYLKGKEKNIRGIIISHGHLDHTGAIPHLLGKLGNPTIFTAKLTRAMIEKRQEEFKESPKPTIVTITDKDRIQLGKLKIEFFHINHNIPDALGTAIHTPQGLIIHTSDFKFDFSPMYDKPTDVGKISRLGHQGVLCLMSDSTSVEQEGFSISEKTIYNTLEKIITDAPGRLIIGTFSSLLNRIQQVISIAEKIGRRVVIEGYSMKTNVEIARQLGYLKIDPKTLVSARESNRLPRKKIIILCTGAQGEEQAILMRIANKEHREIQIEPGDTVIFSSSVIPGNENTVQKLKDSLTLEGANIVHYKMMDVHAGGHGHQDDLKMMIQLTKPKFFYPIHGPRYFLKLHGDLAMSIGIPKENVLVSENGQITQFVNGLGKLLAKKVSVENIMVDGLGVGDVSNVVLRDRQMMAGEGMFVIIATIESKTGRLIGNPDIISRGFVYMKESKKLIEKTRRKVKKILIDKDPKMSANDTYLKNKIRNEIGDFLFQQTERRPMVLPVIIAI